MRYTTNGELHEARPWLESMPQQSVKTPLPSADATKNTRTKVMRLGTAVPLIFPMNPTPINAMGQHSPWKTPKKALLISRAFHETLSLLEVAALTLSKGVVSWQAENDAQNLCFLQGCWLFRVSSGHSCAEVGR
mmetsp:Transcript_80624/g.147028  ORF Transcript_80624/g.147028 Transcript_80624/m.147028 type:complete len:134 (+) Transcript_80624:235-636(+)